MYEIAKIIHLISAVIFGGVLFVEVIMLPVLKKEFGEEFFKKVEFTIIRKRGIKIVPFFVLSLYLTGLYMFHFHLKDLDLSTNFGKVLLLKVSLAFAIVIGVITAITMFKLGKSENKLFDYIHQFAFVAVFTVIILAKLMFIL
ncbi:copper resistance protein CopD [Persephonella sp.]